MYIPDAKWDELIDDTIEMLKYLDNKFLVEPSDPESIKFSHCRFLLHAFLNLNDEPIPVVRKKRTALKGFHKIRQGREYMRKFTKYYVIKLVGERIKIMKKCKRKSKSYIKSTKSVD